jgi:hypothetical protein
MNRSKLLRPAPLGAGTGDAQSLRSYLRDLAMLHCVTLLQLIWVCVLSTRRQDSARKLVPHWLLNTQALVDAFEALTVRSDLRYLTLLPWRNFLSLIGLVTKRQRWCPECLRGSPHERVLWTVQPVTCCRVHKRVLVTECPKCHFVASGQSTWPGWLTCARCGHEHTQSTKVVPADEPSLWVANQVSNLIAKGFQMPEPGRERVVRVWNEVIFPAFPSKAEAGRKLDLSRPVVDLAQRGHRFTLPILLGICRGLTLNLADVVAGDITLLRPQLSGEEYKLPKRKMLPRNQLLEKIHEELAGPKGERHTMRSIAKSVGFSTKRFRMDFPDQAEALVRRREAERRKKTQLRKAHFINTLVQIIQREGPEVSDGELRRQSGQSFFPNTKSRSRKHEHARRIRPILYVN